MVVFYFLVKTVGTVNKKQLDHHAMRTGAKKSARITNLDVLIPNTSQPEVVDVDISN